MVLIIMMILEDNYGLVWRSLMTWFDSSGNAITWGGIRIWDSSHMRTARDQVHCIYMKW